jgi:predicted dithiol-disulfide oxidoreductase (DUF899 family)
MTGSPRQGTLRHELLQEEIALMQHQERVSQLRRSLPLEPVPDYQFSEGPPGLELPDDPRPVRLSGLFSAPERTLIVYHFMFGKAQTQPCPMCTLWLDGINAVAPHLTQRADLAVVGAHEVPHLRRFARARGWRNLRMVSAGDSSFKADFASENATGEQSPAVSVFRLGDDGLPRHFYTGHAEMTAEHFRGIDLLSPLWHLLDLTPEGRDDWYPSLKY